MLATRETDTRDLYLAEFRQASAANSAEPAWLRHVRQAAIDRFLALGFPTTKQEAWRFTNVAPIAGRPFEFAVDGVSRVSRAALAPFTFAGAGWIELVFVNGRLAPGLSNEDRLPRGVEVGSLAGALRGSNAGSLEHEVAAHLPFDQHAFRALNTAFFADGALIRVADGVGLDRPVHLVFVATSGERSSVSHPRVVVLAGENSRVQVVESYVGLDGQASFTNAATEIVGRASSVIDHYKLQREARDAFHMASTRVRLADRATFTSHAVMLGGALARNEIEVILDGERVECTLHGLYLGDGSRHLDTYTSIDHARPNCSSHEIYKGILDDRAHGVFNGRILVRQDAQKTDARQTNKVLLLSEQAQINTKPQLEIFADDVKCTHGATVGQLDPNSMFYLQSRGINRQDARSLLVYAFASDVVSRMALAPVRARLNDILLARLPQPLAELASVQEADEDAAVASAQEDAAPEAPEPGRGGGGQ